MSQSRSKGKRAAALFILLRKGDIHVEEKDYMRETLDYVNQLEPVPKGLMKDAIKDLREQGKTWE